MGHWEIVIPEETTNLISNTSIETNTTGWSAGGILNTVAQSSDQSRFGAYSLLCTYQDNDALASYNLTLTVAAHTFSVWVYIPANYDGTNITLNAINWVGATGTTSSSADMTLTAQWQRVDLTFTPDIGDLTGQFQVRESGTNATVGRTIYIDAAQAEALGYATTYCDGDQPGCEWNGTAHGSTSTRSALSRAGGRVYDLTDDFGMNVTRHADSGVAPISQHINSYALIPGGEVTGYKVHPRVLILSGYVYDDDSWSDFHDLLQDLFGTMAPDEVPNNQPIILRYTEATVTKEIGAIYEGGLEGSWDAQWCAQQRFAIRFICPDPMWYEIGESAVHLDTNDTATLRYIGGRLRSTGQWDDLNVVNNPAGGNTVATILYSSDGILYIGGWFTGWDNLPNRDYVAYYDPQTDTWTTWGALNDFDANVYKILEGPDGTIYAFGSFSTGGGGTCDYIGYWDGANWATLGNPTAGTAAITTVYDACFDSEGNLIIVGNFTNLGGVANADYVGMWTGAAYAAVGGVASGGTGTVYCVTVDNDDNVFIGGTFVNWNADADADDFAWWNGTTWGACGGVDVPGTVYSVDYDERRGFIYLGGTFTNVAGDANADRIACWTGVAFTSLGEGIADGAVRCVKVAPDGTVYVATDNSTIAGGLTLSSSFARWNGSSWNNLDLDWLSIVGEAVECGPADPVIASNYDVFLGSRVTGAVAFSGSVTHTPDGSASAFPVFKIGRSGGTSARLIQIRNETTGKELSFDYDLLDGETLTVDLRPTKKSIESSFFGPRADALLKGSDFGAFALRPGSNQITCFVDVAGAPTITAYAVYRNTYWSIS